MSGIPNSTASIESSQFMTEEAFEQQYGWLRLPFDYFGSVTINMETLSDRQLEKLYGLIQEQKKMGNGAVCGNLSINFKQKKPTKDQLALLVQCIQEGDAKYLYLENGDFEDVENLLGRVGNNRIENLTLTALTDREDSRAAPSVFTHLSEQGKLSRLFMHSCHLSATALEQIAEYVQGNVDLQDLMLSGSHSLEKNNALVESAMERLAETVAKHPHLERFSSPYVMNAKVLAALAESTQLKELGLYGCLQEIDAKDLQDLLPRLIKHPTIQSLDLTANGLAGNDLETISENDLLRSLVTQSLEGVKNISFFSYRHNKIPKVIEAIKKMDGRPDMDLQRKTQEKFLQQLVRESLRGGSSDCLEGVADISPYVQEVVDCILQHPYYTQYLIKDFILTNINILSAQQVKLILRTMRVQDPYRFRELLNTRNGGPEFVEKISSLVPVNEVFDLCFEIDADKKSDDPIYDSGAMAHSVLKSKFFSSGVYAEEYTLLEKMNNLLSIAQEDHPDFEDVIQNLSNKQTSKSKEDLFEFFWHTQIRNALGGLLAKNFGQTEDLNKVFSYLDKPTLDEYSVIKKANVVLWMSVYLIQIRCLINQRIVDQSKLDFDKMMGVVKELTAYAEPNQRFEISNLFVKKVLCSPDGLDFFNELTTGIPNHKIIPAMILSAMCSEQMQKDSSEEIKTSVRLLKDMPLFYKQGLHHQLLVGGLLSLQGDKEIALDEKMKLIQGVLKKTVSVGSSAKIKKMQNDKKKTIASQQKDLLLLEGLLLSGKLSEKIKNQQGDVLASMEVIYKDVFEEILLENLNGLDEKELAEKVELYYQKTFGAKDNGAGLLVYLEKLKTLKSPELVQLFIEYITSVLSENSKDFYRLRYSETRSPHLAKIFSENKQLKNVWQKNEKRSLETFIQENEKSFVVNEQKGLDVETFFKNKVVDHRHLDKQQSEVEPLVQFLKNAGDEKAQAEIFETIKQKYNQSKAETQDLLRRNKAAAALKFQYQLMSLIQESKDPKVSAGGLLTSLTGVKNAAKAYLGSNAELFQDIKALIHHVQRQHKQNVLKKSAKSDKSDKSEEQAPKTLLYPGYTIELTDDFWQLFMCGTEIQGSCQRIHGSPNLNQCLLAYMMDGKNKLIAIRDKDGRLKARSILRLMLTKEGEPVLFKESNYPEPSEDTTLDLAMDLYAVEIARSLNLSLFSKDSPLPQVGDGGQTLCSLGSVAPQEYVDANYSQAQDGQFEIVGSRCVFQKPVLDFQPLYGAYRGRLVEQANTVETIIQHNRPQPPELAITGRLVEQVEQLENITWHNADPELAMAELVGGKVKP